METDSLRQVVQRLSSRLVFDFIRSHFYRDTSGVCQSIVSFQFLYTLLDLFSVSFTSFSLILPLPPSFPYFTSSISSSPRHRSPVHTLCSPPLTLPPRLLSHISFSRHPSSPPASRFSPHSSSSSPSSSLVLSPPPPPRHRITSNIYAAGTGADCSNTHITVSRFVKVCVCVCVCVCVFIIYIFGGFGLGGDRQHVSQH